MRKRAARLPLYRLLDALPECRPDAADRGELRNWRLAQPPDAPESSKQCPLLGRADALNVVEDAADGTLGANVLVVGHREPVRLVTDALHEVEPLRCPRQDDRVGPRGNEQLLALLRERRDRDLQKARVGEGSLARRELPLAAVEDHKIWEGPAGAVGCRALEPAAERLAHVGEVVVPVDDLRSEPSVRVLRGTPVFEHDHRADDARPLHVAHVVALDALGRSLEAERLGELAEGRIGLSTIGQPAHALLLECVTGVPFGELGEVTLLAPLRHEGADRTTATLGGERFE